MMIRPATLDDASAILALRNAPESVFWSGTPKVSEPDHAEWFPQHMKSMLVLCNPWDHVMGYVRVAEDGRVSFAVDALVAGQGHGRRLLQALEDHFGHSRFYAVVHPSNIASMRAFMHAGYTIVRNRVEDGVFHVVEKCR